MAFSRQEAVQRPRLLKQEDLDRPIEFEYLVDAADILTRAGFEPDDAEQRSVALYMRSERDRLMGNAAFPGESFSKRWEEFWDELPNRLQKDLLPELLANLNDIESAPNNRLLSKITGLIPSAARRLGQLAHTFAIRPNDTDTYKTAAEKLNWYERRVAQRIGNRAIKAIEGNKSRESVYDLPVRGGILGLRSTVHNPQLYEAVDDDLKSHAIRLKVVKTESGTHEMEVYHDGGLLRSIVKDQVYPKVYWG